MSTTLVEQEDAGQPIARLLLTIPDLQALHANYMPFIKDGGIFVPTSQHFSLYDEVILEVRLVGEGKKLTIIGRVVWLSHGSGHRGAMGVGVGIQLRGQNRARIRQFIEELLGDLARSPSASPAY